LRLAGRVHDGSAGDVPAAGGRAPVTVATPVVRTVPVLRRYPGHVEAMERVELRSRVSGYVQSVDFEEGEFVRKGAVLVRIDPRPYAAAVAEARAAWRASAGRAGRHDPGRLGRAFHAPGGFGARL
jgi:multidrug efflux system membrane fusion protein